VNGHIKQVVKTNNYAIYKTVVRAFVWAVWQGKVQTRTISRNYTAELSLSMRRKTLTKETAFDLIFTTPPTTFYIITSFNI
jgi:hypothetical protein